MIPASRRPGYSARAVRRDRILISHLWRISNSSCERNPAYETRSQRVNSTSNLSKVRRKKNCIEIMQMIQCNLSVRKMCDSSIRATHGQYLHVSGRFWLGWPWLYCEFLKWKSGLSWVQNARHFPERVPNLNESDSELQWHSSTAACCSDSREMFLVTSMLFLSLTTCSLSISWSRKVSQGMLNPKTAVTSTATFATIGDYSYRRVAIHTPISYPQIQLRRQKSTPFFSIRVIFIIT